jgi:hypothetical protein
MKKPWQFLGIIAATAGLSALGCGSSSSNNNADAAVPTMQIVSPVTGAAVVVTATDATTPVTVTATDFTLKAPGACAGASACGHLHVFVDGTACNAPGMQYNAQGASPVSANFAFCQTVNGSHTIKVELHHDDHSPVTAGGATIAESIDVTVSGG